MFWLQFWPHFQKLGDFFNLLVTLAAILSRKTVWVHYGLENNERIAVDQTSARTEVGRSKVGAPRSTQFVIQYSVLKYLMNFFSDCHSKLFILSYKYLLREKCHSYF
jgi:hypothetical protein